MITFKEVFIQKYLAVLNHKILQELQEKLPDKGFFAEMITQSNKIVFNITKEEYNA
jgi:predicted transcriptional regulator